MFSKSKIDVEPIKASVADNKGQALAMIGKIEGGHNPECISPADFPIVGVGASAGGLAAFEAFFAGMPAGEYLNMAFVLIQHLAPDHTSILVELVQRYTSMKVYQVEDGMVVKPNSVYIIPPNKDMTFFDGELLLQEPIAARGLRMPIDFFFRSLANDQHERAICVILSGTGSDGTLGMRSIKAEGGLVIIQSPESAGFDGMPNNAISTGIVDYVLSPMEMIPAIIKYVSQISIYPSSNRSGISKSENTLKKIFVLLRNQFGHDFSQYKLNTIMRRVERRMALHQIGTIEAYLKYLQGKNKEADALFGDMLIGVTGFFRDPHVFTALEEEVIPKLLKKIPTQHNIRVWSVGCSTGEEAYSLAILLSEANKACNHNYKIQIFASDIDKRAIAIARAGLYSFSIAADLTPERLDQYFAVENGLGYRVKKSIRDMILFSEQDVIRDPPFSKLDLISCRNLLIYFGPQLQKKLIPLFHYALNQDGFLILGTSETIGDFSNLFSALDRKSKVYQAKANLLGRDRISFGDFYPIRTSLEKSVSVYDKQVAVKNIGVKELAEKAILQYVAKTAVLVNSKGDILYFHGRTGEYLEPFPGKADVNNIIKMAREGLRRELTISLHKAMINNVSTQYPNIRVKTNGSYSLVNLSIYPVMEDLYANEPMAEDPEPKSRLFLVVFEHSYLEPEKFVVSQVPQNDQDLKTRIMNLEKDLTAKEAYIQSTNQAIATANEELQSSNEEMQSINEELQSTNEELETSKEELQSINEELTTVNTELQIKNSELIKNNNDMKNLLSGTGIGTVFVDFGLNILRFTPSITKVINLINGDIGRPISHISSNLVGYTELVSDTQEVIDTLIPKEIEVEAVNGQYFNMNIRPYRTLENVIEGAVITFADVTQRKKIEKAFIESNAQMAEAIVSTVRQPLIVLDDKLRVAYANRSFYSAFLLDPTATIGKPLYELDDYQWESPELRRILEDVLQKNSVFNDYEITQEDHCGGKRAMRISGRRLFGGFNQLELILLAIEDITPARV